jgi:hypothetical protein
MHNFIVAAPAFSSRSGGIMVLHELCTALNRAGFKAGLTLITEGSQDSQGFKFGYSNNTEYLDPRGLYYDYFTDKSTIEIERFVANSIAIYPDIIIGNPLNTLGYCTYVLGIPKWKIESEFIIRFSKLYIEECDFTLHKSFIDPCMNDIGTKHWSERDLSLTYIGKGAQFTKCNTILDSVLIERDWPRTKNELALLLKNSKILFSWDCISATNADAALCGAIPILLHDAQMPRNKLNTGEYGPLPIINDISHNLIEYLSVNSQQIDIMLTNFKLKMHFYHNSWQQNVTDLVKCLEHKFS